jgi:hypothetical protein
VGVFDYVRVEGEAFRCSEGHDLAGEEFQTKDLGCTMGQWLIGERFSGKDGGYGEAPELPFIGRIHIYSGCRQCPALVQAGTMNLCETPVGFVVEIVDDLVRKVRRVSPDTATFLAEYAQEEFMRGCYGPMPYGEAEEMHRAGLGQRSK